MWNMFKANKNNSDVIDVDLLPLFVNCIQISYLNGFHHRWYNGIFWSFKKTSHTDKLLTASS